MTSGGRQAGEAGRGRRAAATRSASEVGTATTSRGGVGRRQRLGDVDDAPAAERDEAPAGHRRAQLGGHGVDWAGRNVYGVYRIALPEALRDRGSYRKLNTTPAVAA